MHRWPFDVEEQIVFSTLADLDLGFPNVGQAGTPGQFDGGITQIRYPQVTPDNDGNHGSGERGHSAIITMFEACWLTDWSATFEKEAAVVMESGTATVSDIHDFASVYGEFLASGNDPTIGQLGSIRYGGSIAQAGSSILGGGTTSQFINP